jgi:hypothetical protein
MSNQPTQVTRDYAIADDNMLQDSRNTQALLATDIADFTAQDAMFTPAYATAWQAAITAAENEPTDEIYLDIQEQKKEVADTELANSRDLFQKSKYTIDKAFGTNVGILHEFGYDNYDTARKSHSGMQSFLNNFFTVADKYSAQLIAKGFTAEIITAITTQKNALENATKAWKTHELGRGTATQNRVIAVNAVWKYRREVANAAKYIYADNYAKYQQYLLPASEESADTFIISGVVTDAATNTPLAGVTVTVGGTTSPVTTDSKGKYGLAKLDAGSYTASYSKLGYTTKTEAITIGEKALVVNVALAKV